ncbi:hypothetical protein EON67_05950 [archaeon]|nr:MAG: hypothetical protein EON67_05950 [archaeon]
MFACLPGCTLHCRVHHEGSDAEAASAADITLPTVLAALPAISVRCTHARMHSAQGVRIACGGTRCHAAGHAGVCRRRLAVPGWTA